MSRISTLRTTLRSLRKSVFLVSTILALRHFSLTLSTSNYARFIQSDCQICLTVCAENSSGLNIPRDYGTLQQGMGLFPPRVDLFGSRPNKDPSAWTFDATCPYSAGQTTKLLENIQKIVVNFYENSAEKMTMRSDGGYGLRMLSNQLQYVASKLSGHSERLKSLQTYLTGLSHKSGELGDFVLNLAADSIEDKSVHQGMQLVLNKKDLLHTKDDFTWRPEDIIQQYFPEFKDKIGEEAEVVYPYLDFHCRVALVESCSVPFVCKKMYLEEPYSQYMLLHQVMYLQYAKKSGCVERRPEDFAKSEEFLDRLCSKAYLEAEFLESNEFPTRYMDLFAEQVGFCGLAGYPNFVREDWLREIMSWQSKSDSGCFLNHYKDARTTDAVVKVESMMNGEIVEEECLVHLSSVGLMALAIHLRHIADVCPVSNFLRFEPNTVKSPVENLTPEMDVRLNFPAPQQWVWE